MVLETSTPCRLVLTALDTQFRPVFFQFCVLFLQIVEETIPELVELKKEGLVQHIGITGLPLPIYKKVLDRLDTNHRSIHLLTRHLHLATDFGDVG